MYKGKTILALTPARGGSKGLPRKNVKLLRGKPLIAWTIEEAKKSAYIDKIVVSTDDNEISRVSRKYGAEVPFIRPKKLANDNAKTIDVALHAINRLESDGLVYDLILVLQPTSPLRTAGDVDEAVKLFFLKDAKAVLSVCEAEYNPCWMNVLPKDGCMKNFLQKDIFGINRQRLAKFYRLNGAIYLVCIDYLKKQKSFFGKKSYAYIMPKERSVDIDDKVDFMFAELLFKKGYAE